MPEPQSVRGRPRSDGAAAQDLIHMARAGSSTRAANTDNAGGTGETARDGPRSSRAGTARPSGASHSDAADHIIRVARFGLFRGDRTP